MSDRSFYYMVMSFDGRETLTEFLEARPGLNVRLASTKWAL